jgi:ribulose-5-phosphate 4-epimerase/fuculose-1-phosphate aldolase
VQQMQIKDQLLEGCNRLVSKGFLRSPADSFSLRVPGKMEMVMISEHENWDQVNDTDVRVVPFSIKDDSSALHARIYQQRGDVGAIAVSSPKGVRLLAGCGGLLPPIFDEQVRHIGPSIGSLTDEEAKCKDMLWKTFKSGANAALLDERLLCLGMTRDRALFNTELYEKCARAYVIAKACDRRISHVPLWVRLIANRSLLKDEGIARASYREGRVPEAVNVY